MYMYMYIESIWSQVSNVYVQYTMYIYMLHLYI